MIKYQNSKVWFKVLSLNRSLTDSKIKLEINFKIFKKKTNKSSQIHKKKSRKYMTF